MILVLVLVLVVFWVLVLFDLGFRNRGRIDYNILVGIQMIQPSYKKFPEYLNFHSD